MDHFPSRRWYVGCNFELYARIRRSVNDPSGSKVPGVQIAATNDATGITRQVVSAPDGSYELINLPVGTYRLSATKEGFKTYDATGIVLTVNQVYVLDIPLFLGQISEKVKVQADPIKVETTRMQLGTVVAGQSIVDLPLNGRDWLQLQQLQPGVVSQSDHRTDTYATNGSQAQQNSFLINGADSNNFFGNTPATIPSPDAIAEFRMDTNTINPEYGRRSGAIMNAIIKSGTNQTTGAGNFTTKPSNLGSRGRHSVIPSNPFKGISAGCRNRGNGARNETNLKLD